MSDVLPSTHDILPARAGIGDVALGLAEVEFQSLSRRIAEKMLFAAQIIEQPILLTLPVWGLWK
jgi:hypothetical protein